MQLKMYSIYDSKAKVYNRPVFLHSDPEAERMLKMSVQDPNSLISKFPEDYDLFAIGTYDDQTGKIVPNDSPTHIVKALHLTDSQVTQLSPKKTRK